ncbi:MAG: OmpA/MotB family protein [Rhodospirillales bacterium]
MARRRRQIQIEAAETADSTDVFKDAGVEDESIARVAAQAWLITFTDLVSLLLTFFVMLFGMSDVNIEKWDLIIAALTKTLNPEAQEEVKKQTVEFNIGTLFRQRAVDLDYLEDVLEDAIAGEPQLARVRLTRLDDRLILALPEDILFNPGRAELHDRARSAVFVLGGVFSNVGNELQINGHTDPVPPSPGFGYATNWELSIARATAVANAFRQVGYKDKIVALGYADSRFHMLPDVSDRERRALARRVDVIVTPEASRR